MMRVLLHTNDPDPALEILHRHHPDLQPAICDTYEGLGQRVAEIDPEVVYTCRFQAGDFPRDGLIAAPGVRWISNAGSGCNHLMPWDPTRITVTNSAGVAAEAMAQWTIGCMLHFALDIPGLQADQRDRIWRQGRSFMPLDGRTLLQIRLGQTGRETARIARAMGMMVIGVRANPKPTDHVAQVVSPAELIDVIGRADFISICLPLTDASRGLIGEDLLARVKPGAILEDQSRGGILDHRALVEALDGQNLRAAALDVFPTEPPPPDDPLWTRDDVLISPHCSGAFDGWERRMMERFCENLTRYRRGDRLLNIVDPVVGYSVQG